MALENLRQLNGLRWKSLSLNIRCSKCQIDVIDPVHCILKLLEMPDLSALYGPLIPPVFCYSALPWRPPFQQPRNTKSGSASPPTAWVVRSTSRWGWKHDSTKNSVDAKHGSKFGDSQGSWSAWHDPMVSMMSISVTGKPFGPLASIVSKQVSHENTGPWHTHIPVVW